MKKRFLGIALVSVFALASCGFNNLTHIEDTNGADDYSLCSLTEEDLLAKNPHALFQMSMKNAFNSNLSFSCEMFSGVSDLLTVSFNEYETYTFKITSKVESGNSEFFLYQNGKKLRDIGFGEDMTIEITGVNGNASFRAAGESAKLNIKVEKQ